MANLKILITIPHYYKYDPQSKYGSGTEKKEARLRALEAELRAIRFLFTKPHEYTNAYLQPDGKQKFCCNSCDGDMHYDIDICLCTTGENHLAKEINLPGIRYTHVDCTVEDPMYLGFACHKVLRSHWEEYDYYCYMEDDLVIHDAYFFQKLQWFEKLFGSECLLQPYRYMSYRDMFVKSYVDYEWGGTREAYLSRGRLEADYLGRKIQFLSDVNWHSGCFFLSSAQYERMLSREECGKPNAKLIGPLESAASYDIGETFRVYKPDWPQACFFEIEHAGNMKVPVGETVVNLTGFREAGYKIGQMPQLFPD